MFYLKTFFYTFIYKDLPFKIIIARAYYNVTAECFDYEILRFNYKRTISIS